MALEEDEEFKACMMRAVGLMPSIGTGAIVSGTVQRQQDLALIELAVLTARRYYSTPSFLALPAHLPDGEAEMKALLFSVAANDVQMKEDLVTWISENRVIAARGAVSLKNLFIGLHKAHALVQEFPAVPEGEEPGEEEKKIAAWRNELWEAIEATHVGSKVALAPRDPVELEAHCAGIIDLDNPVPDWARSGHLPRHIFQAKKKKAEKKGTKPRDLIPFNPRED